MAWKTVDIHEQRVRFVVAATQRLQPFSSLCAEFGISRPTGYLWLRRYQQAGIRGIAEQSRKPHSSPSRTAARLEERVSQVRLRYPDWGARKLRVVLSRGEGQRPKLENQQGAGRRMSPACTHWKTLDGVLLLDTGSRNRPARPTAKSDSPP
jgi:transposase